jgi:hypothetical protein
MIPLDPSPITSRPSANGKGHRLFEDDHLRWAKVELSLGVKATFEMPQRLWASQEMNPTINCCWGIK